MKKVKVLIASCLSLFLIWGSAVGVLAANEGSMGEYEKVIAEVNQEIGTDLSIPYEDSSVINNIKQKTPSEFKKSLLSSYADAISTPSDIYYDATATPSTRAYIEKRQEARPANNIYVFIDAGIETLGPNYRPIYVNVLSTGNYILSGIAYFSAYQKQTTTNGVGYDTITVRYKGRMVSPEGLELVPKTVTVTYRAS